MKGFLRIGTIMMVTMVFLSAYPGFCSAAADAVLIKIQPEGTDTVTGFSVDPETATVKKNTIVVWMSGVPDIEVQIVFHEGKTCRDITANPNQKHPGFFMDSKNCYVTSFLPYCATTTLQFPEEGSFEYKVVTEDGKMRSKGKIVVK